MSSLIFNVIDWHEFDEQPIDNSSDDSDNKPAFTFIDREYIIRCFGRTEDFKSVYLRIEKFPPHFYVLLPESWTINTQNKINHLVQLIKNKINNFERTLTKYEVVNRKKFYGFNGEKSFNFLRLVFKNKKSMLDCSRIFDYPIQMFNSSNNNIGIRERVIKFEIYESNIDPYIRFMHIQNLQSCGWIKIDQTKLKKNYEETTCDLAYTVEWTDVHSINLTQIAPFYVCSFDLECRSIDGSFPQAIRQHDQIIQIGLTFNKYGSSDIIKRIMISLGTCDSIDSTEVVQCRTEAELLLKFSEIIQREDPDILTGYNIFSFDQPYLNDRAIHPSINVDERFFNMSKLKNYRCKLQTKNISSAALGDNKMAYFDTIGRVHIDLMKVAQRDYKLSSYKLDSVAENFFKDKIINIEKVESTSTSISTSASVEYRLYSKSVQILTKGNYIRFEKDQEIIHQKYRIIDISYSENYIICENLSAELLTKCKLFWGMVKDDIKPQEIFDLYMKTSADRKLIAEYCIQDCALVSKLMAKLEILTNNISMATVCHVPLHYIFFRGQGIKALSLVAKYCRQKGFLMPVLKKIEDEDNTGYEGATVMEPDINFHKKPIPVLDFNSLYPSSIISKNVSHEMFVQSPEYDNMPNYTYYDVSYTDNNNNQIKCRYAKKKDVFGVIPSILMDLLSKRKETKKEMAKENDPFKKNILDGKQNAYKITANSIYGQLGASTSPIYFKHGAACTTAIGRGLLYFAKEFVENSLPNILYSLYIAIKESKLDIIESLYVEHLKERNTEFENFLINFLIELFDNYSIKPKIVYGDTDSIFINFDMKLKETNEDTYTIETLKFNIELGKIASKFLKTLLPYPHNMEYEKTFYPFALMAKKKYIGNKYEEDPTSFKQTSMGVVLKRRDNANIVKKIIGGMVNIMMNEIDVQKAIRFIKQSVNDLLNGKYSIEDFITSKTLKADYVDRTRLAHVVLADRMAERDPGNAPQLNDRIPFVAIETIEKKGVKLLQGNRIEHPEYILEKKLKIDYLFYLTNQIINPASQFLELVMKPSDVENIFNEYIISESNRRKGIKPLTKCNINIISDSLDITNDEFVNNFTNNFSDNILHQNKLITNDAKPNNKTKSKKKSIIANTKIIDSDDDIFF